MEHWKNGLRDKELINMILFRSNNPTLFVLSSRRSVPHRTASGIYDKRVPVSIIPTFQYSMSEAKGQSYQKPTNFNCL
jgi:hypothetical protein